MNLNNVYLTTLQLVDNPNLIDVIYKEKESVLSDENKLRIEDWLSFFNEHHDEFSNIYSGTINAIFHAITDKELFLKLGEKKTKYAKNFICKFQNVLKKIR